MKSITENINDLENLNKELDKLGTAMANIDDANNFNLGDLDAVADYFLGLSYIVNQYEYADLIRYSPILVYQ